MNDAGRLIGPAEAETWGDRPRPSVAVDESALALEDADVIAARLGMMQLPGGQWAERDALAGPCSCGGTWKWVAAKCVRCVRCLPPGRDDHILGWVDCRGRRITRHMPAELVEGVRHGR